MYQYGSVPITYYPLAEAASGGIIPPVVEDFLLLDGTNFLLLDTEDLVLL